MATLREEIDRHCAPHGLTCLGLVEVEARTHALIGTTPEFWHIFRQSPEYGDSAADPIDRWSARTLRDIAETLKAQRVVFPFGGPPYAPFIQWAFDSGETFSSPVGMLVHHRAGFWISFRGALVFDERLEARDGPWRNPCLTCAAPCTTACPVGALATGTDYDVPACKSHVASHQGKACREGGCLVRRACPVSQSYGRDPAQSAFHMEAFLGGGL